jgi:Tat protein secretion system quality control protein TatD with DNase activity
MHDTHVHLEMLLEKLKIIPSDSRKNSPQILTKDQKMELEVLLKNHDFVIQSTVSWDNFGLVWKLFNEFDKIKFLFGTHPELVDNDFEIERYLMEQKHFWENWLEKNLNLTGLTAGKKIENLAKLIGVGEIGLDYFYTQDSNLVQTQRKLFESQIDLSLEISQEIQQIRKTIADSIDKSENLILGSEIKINSHKKLPIIIHCRFAFDDLLAILKNFPQVHNNFLIHCFTGDIDNLRQILDFGGVVAFGGILTYKNAEKLREAANFCPLSSLVLETDLPFLSPQTQRGQVCLPSFIQEIVDKLSEIKHVTPQEIWQNSLQNTQNLFSL